MEPVTASVSSSVVDRDMFKKDIQIDSGDSENGEVAVQANGAQQSEPVKSDTDSLIGTHLDISV